MNLTSERQFSRPYEKQQWRWVEQSMVHHDMKLSGTLWIPKEQKTEPFPLLIVAPGILADESQDVVQSIADTVVRDLGIAVFTMNYDNSDVWTYTLGHKQALDYTVNHVKKSQEIDGEKIGILGVSYGGGIALLAREKRKAVIVLGAPINPFAITRNPYFQRFSRLREDGAKLIGLRGVRLASEFENPVPHKQDKPSDIEDKKLLAEYATFHSPVVLIHADEGADGLIPAEESRRIFDAVPNGSLFILEKPKQPMNPKQVHNFEGSLRAPMLAVVKEAVKNLLIEDKPSWLQKRG
ncbi:MAG: hypothetical protein UY49_C0043G0003 [Microgenomates group bacterium GW2011_GWC1_49_7]|nr:MAG: hypothetical protein UY49_C0043G0003 [Microgenomates group bacterium GW2011_GWC1_49_7]